MSTAAQRLQEAQRTYREAFRGRLKDYKDAKTDAQVKAIQRNLNAAEEAYLEAGVAVLAETGAAVEKAYNAAKDANAAVTKARENAQALAERIRLTAGAVTAVKDLVKAATSKKK